MRVIISTSPDRRKSSTVRSSSRPAVVVCHCVEAVAKIKEKAVQRAMDLQGIVESIKRSGITIVRAIAAELNRQGIHSPRGASWHPTAVARLLNRLPQAA
jgi:hypothetical protein